MNALYVKSRIFTLLNRLQETDELHDQIAKKIEKTIEPKLLYQGAIINEIHCNIPSPSFLQVLASYAPNTLEVHYKLREFLRGRDGILREEEASENTLIIAFNQPLADNTFNLQLAENHEQNTEAYNQYLCVLKAQVFE